MKFILTVTLCFLAVSNSQAQDPVKFDLYSDLSFKEEKSRLDLIALQLKEGSSWVVYFDIYAGRRSCMGEAQARGIRAKNYLVSKHGIAPDRIIWRDGGFREDFSVEVWVEPRGAQAMPLMPTIKRDDAQIMKDCRRKYHRQRDTSTSAPNNSFNRSVR